MKKSEFLSRVRETRAELDALVARVPSRQMEQPGVNQHWTVKDLLAHIAWYELEMIDILQTRVFGGSELWGLPHDQRNQAIHEHYQTHTLQDVLTESQESRDRLLAALETLTDADLVDPASFPGMPADWQPWDVMASNTFEHYLEHIPQLKDWLQADSSK